MKKIKPPISYYGGKQRMASKIVPLIPRHTVYVEPFAGGAAVLFAKPWPDVTNSDHYREVINDTNSDVVNFYRVLRESPDELARVISLTPYAREDHKLAREPCDDPIERARRFYVDCNTSFNNSPGNSWCTGIVTRNNPRIIINKNSRIPQCAERFTGVFVEHDDAINVIKRWDSPQTFFYCDPPYPGADQGHYSGYTMDDFAALVDTLNNAQGSFLLSNYEQPIAMPDSWERIEFAAYASSSGRGTTGPGRDKTKKATNTGDRKRTEVIWKRGATATVRPEIQKLYDAGKFDCFTG